MARVKIVKSRNCRDDTGKDECEFVVEILEGDLVPGDQFRLYETHHFTDYTVLSLNPLEDTCVVRAKPDLWYEGWHEGSILDTQNLEAGIRYGSGGAGKHLYHPDALSALDIGEDDPETESK